MFVMLIYFLRNNATISIFELGGEKGGFFMNFSQVFTDRQGKLKYYKRCNKILAQYGSFPDKTRERISSCRNYLRIRVEPGGKRTVDFANSCGNRLCPWCAAQKSRADRYEFAQVLSQLEHPIQGEPRYDFFKVELTWPNCEPEDLKESFKDGGRMFNKLMQAIRPDGFFRSSEFTVGKKDHHTFHPHFHTLLCFDKDKGICLDQLEDAIRRLWSKYYDNPNIQVNVTKFYPSDGKLGDFAKYILKLGDLYDDRLVPDIDKPRMIAAASEGINGIRSVGYGGVMKEMRKMCIRFNRALLLNQFEDIEGKDILDTTSLFFAVDAADNENFIHFRDVALEYSDIDDVDGDGINIWQNDDESFFCMWNLYPAQYPSRLTSCSRTYQVYGNLSVKAGAHRNICELIEVGFYQGFDFDAKHNQYDPAPSFSDLHFDPMEDPYDSEAWSFYCNRFVEGCFDSKRQELFLTKRSYKLLAHGLTDPVLRMYWNQFHYCPGTNTYLQDPFDGGEQRVSV